MKQTIDKIPGQRQEHRKQTLRSLAGTAAAAIAFAPAAVGFGVANGQYTDSLGSVGEVDYHTNFDGMTLDTGMLGDVHLPSSGPLGIGVRAELHNAPINDPRATFQEFLTSPAVTEQIMLLRDRPELYMKNVEQQLRNDVLEKIALSEAAWIAACLGAVALRCKNIIIIDGKGKKLVSSVMVGAMASTATMAMAGLQHHQAENAPRVPITALAGTPFAELTTNNQILADTIVPVIKRTIDQQTASNDAFVAEINTKVDALLPTALAHDNTEQLVMTMGDIHCNFPMTEVLQHMGDLVEPDVAIDLGDSTTSGLTFEESCVAAQRKIAKILVYIGGNHDSSTTESQMNRYGAIILKGKMVVVDGLSILGDKDPEYTPYFSTVTDLKAYLKNEKKLGKRLLLKALIDRPTILAVHEPEAIDWALNDSSQIDAKLVLTAHHHTQAPMKFIKNSDGTITDYQNVGTAGGVAPGEGLQMSTPFSTPQTDAVVNFFLIDRVTKQPTKQIVLTITPDRKVQAKEMLLQKQ